MTTRNLIKAIEAVLDDPRRGYERRALAPLAARLDAEIKRLNETIPTVNDKATRQKLTRDRQTAGTIKRALGDRLADVKKAAGPTTVAPMVKALLDAIAAHRRASERADIEPEPHDLVLWAVLGPSVGRSQ